MTREKNAVNSIQPISAIFSLTYSPTDDKMKKNVDSVLNREKKDHLTSIVNQINAITFEFSLNVFTEFSEISDKTYL